PDPADRAAVPHDRRPAVGGGRADPGHHRGAGDRRAGARPRDRGREGVERGPGAVRADLRRRAARGRGQRRVPRAGAPGAGLAPERAAGGGVTRALRSLARTLGLPVVLFALLWVVSAGSKSFYLPPLRAIVGVFGPTWSPLWTSDVLPSIAR